LWEGGHHGSSYIEHLEFIDAIRSGAPAAVTVEDGLLSVAMGLAAQTAIAERRVVEMAEVL
ncbi:MAG: gfo/Idh/MocA family oxidoreductase, partial [Acidimicrobiia bacterium]|nr:gfo/Idh/MocA family oxidoreductase [Acidimicrobiia bacterium]